jgi:phosphohistidine phosphatase SixA
VLAEHDIERVVTSPLARCVETVAPIADVRRVVVERRNELLPEARIEDTRVLLEDLPDASLVCTHHEVILQLFGGEVSCEEAGTLVLQRDGALWTPVSYIAPPGTAAEPFARTLAAR